MWKSSSVKFSALCAFFLLLSFSQAVGSTVSATTTNTASHYIGIAWPTKAGGQLPMPVYVYQCSDSTCTQKHQIDYITSIPAQGKVAAPVPAPITFYPTGGKAVTYELYTKTGDSKAALWGSCKITIPTNAKPGPVLPSESNCTGAVVQDTSTPSVTMISFSGAGFTSLTDKYPNSPNKKVTVQPRTLTFINNSKYNKICINTEGNYADDPATNKCTLAGDVILTKGVPYVVPVPPLGAISGAAAVTGFYESPGDWENTGKYVNPKNSQVEPIYATKMEWTMFPTALYSPAQEKHLTTPITTNHSIGMTNIDVSAVDGFNFPVTLTTDNGAICASTDYNSDGSVNPSKFIYTPAEGQLAQVPNKNMPIHDLCPTASGYAVKNGNKFLGCLSECSYQIINNPDGDKSINAEWACCSKGSKYATSPECTQALSPYKLQSGNNGYHKDLAYVTNISNNANHVFSWAYDDVQGDYSCDPNASFTFVIGDSQVPAIVWPATNAQITAHGTVGTGIGTGTFQENASIDKSTDQPSYSCKTNSATGQCKITKSVPGGMSTFELSNIRQGTDTEVLVTAFDPNNSLIKSVTNTSPITWVTPPPPVTAPMLTSAMVGPGGTIIIKASSMGNCANGDCSYSASVLSPFNKTYVATPEPSSSAFLVQAGSEAPIFANRADITITVKKGIAVKASNAVRIQ